MVVFTAGIEMITFDFGDQLLPLQVFLSCFKAPIWSDSTIELVSLALTTFPKLHWRFQEKPLTLLHSPRSQSINSACQVWAGHTGLEEMPRGDIATEADVIRGNKIRRHSYLGPSICSKVGKVLRHSQLYCGRWQLGEYK